MRCTKPLLFAILILLPSACTFPGMFPGPAPAAIGSISPLLVGAPPDATATPTPFQPLPPTPTYFPTDFPTPEVPPPATPVRSGDSWGDYPGPSEPPSIPIPPPVGRLPQPQGQVNILLLGSDQRPGYSGFRTDTLLLLTLNPRLETASLISFPRDLYVYIPGWTMQRINTAHARGGFETSALTFEYNFGVRPDHFVLINFWSFVQAIDSLGGIDVQMAAPLGDHRDGIGYFYLPAGLNHMDGQTALWYVRSRYTTNDFARTRRHQEILQATFEKVLSLEGIKRAPELFRIYVKNVTTDLEFSDVAPLIPLAAKLRDTSRIRNYFIDQTMVTNWVTPTGGQVLLPNREAILETMRQALNVP